MLIKPISHSTTPVQENVTTIRQSLNANYTSTLTSGSSILTDIRDSVYKFFASVWKGIVWIFRCCPENLIDVIKNDTDRAAEMLIKDPRGFTKKLKEEVSEDPKRVLEIPFVKLIAAVTAKFLVVPGESSASVQQKQSRLKELLDTINAIKLV